MGVSTSYSTYTDEGAARSWIAVEPGLKFPRYAGLSVTDDPRLEVDLDLDLAFNINQSRYEIDNLTVLRRNADTRIDGTALRAIPVQEVMRDMGWVARIAETGEVMPRPLPEDLAARLRQEGPSNAETLLWVARVYVTANAVMQAPTQAVRDNFGISMPTASVWIRRARDRGVLPDVSHNPEQMPLTDFERAKELLRDG